MVERSACSSSPAFSKSPSVDPSTWYPIEPSEDRMFKLLYVPDASRGMRRCFAERNLAWTKREIRFDQFEAIKDLSGFVHKCGENRNGVRVILTEWLWLLLMVNDFEDGGAFDVRFMRWEEFRDIVLDPPRYLEGWTTLTQMDCIIGGFDYASGQCDPNNPYGMNAKLLEMYEAHVAQLSCHTQFWPPIRLTRRAADKWTTICHLKIIAQDSSLYAPRTRILKHEEAIPPDAVLKRSHSECGRHVLLPSASPRCRTWEYLSTITNNGTFWMAQEHVPSLEWLGEWRVLIVGGRIITVMHTYKLHNGEWTGSEVHEFRTLDEVSRIVELETTSLDAVVLRQQIVNPQSGTAPVRRQGKREFHEFVMQTWRSLVLRETKDTGAKPSLCVFCRIDVGIRLDTSGTVSPQYFVNEVERTQNTSLWLYHIVGKTMGTFADTFAMVLKRWLMDIHNPHVL
ncbi:hypothetical protein L210DRAFT_870722 [Boletus edulis BED1]|uniref:Uncharacterized protein n=1 Tax=Boletus edulis BED1 TaxID=1328754 RepID=A0AAD4BNF6_BOLED|nr:hypothetical protein L210DRAFT_870722 [Boletus edulis BED1]